MSEPATDRAFEMERYLDGAYPRILKIAVALGLAGAGASLVLGDWHATIALAVGALIGTLNVIWLHRGADLLVKRMLSRERSGPSQLSVMLFFPLRYLLVIAAVYAILKGYPGVLVSFIVGLGLPVLALIGESIYEAIVLSKKDRT